MYFKSCMCIKKKGKGKERSRVQTGTRALTYLLAHDKCTGISSVKPFNQHCTNTTFFHNFQFPLPLFPISFKT